jgi:hypothetical protein
MTTGEMTQIAAVLLSPLVAVQVQQWLDRFRQRRARKDEIFKILMSTRGNRLSIDHVFALNQIDLEFSRKNPKERKVIEAWKSYHDHLNNRSETETFDLWVSKGEDLLVELLYEMGQVLGHDYGRTEIRRSAYTPQGHADADLEFSMIRKSFHEILQGTRRFPVDLGLPSPYQSAALESDESTTEAEPDGTEGN